MRSSISLTTPFTSISQDDAGVQVTFERSAPRSFDFVVGADGLHSNVRRLVFGDESRFTHDMGCYVAIFGAPNEYRLDGWELIYNIPGNRRTPGKSVGIYPVRANAEVNAMFYFTAPHLRYDRHDIPQQKQLLAEAFAGEGWEIPRLLEAMWAAPDIYFDRVAMAQMDRWSSGRVALLGDAAYCPSPMSGMGTSLALVGAYVLAGELSVAATITRPHLRVTSASARRGRNGSPVCPNGTHRFLLPTSRTQMWMTNQVMRMMAHLPSGLMSSGVEKAANAVTVKGLQPLWIRRLHLPASIPAPETPRKSFAHPAKGVGLPYVSNAYSHVQPAGVASNKTSVNGRGTHFTATNTYSDYAVSWASRSRRRARRPPIRPMRS